MNINKHNFFGTDTRGLRHMTHVSRPLTTNAVLLTTAKRLFHGRMGISNRIQYAIVHDGESKHSEAVAMYSYNKTYDYVGDALSRVEGSYFAYAYRYPIIIR